MPRFAIGAALVALSLLLLLPALSSQSLVKAQSLLPCDQEVMCGGARSSISIIGSTFPNCICECLPNFDGQWCERCQFNFTGDFCDTCKSGFGTLPQCVEQCTDPVTSCTNHSVPNGLTVNVAWGNCSCECLPEYAGARCDRCAPGYTQYPTCYPPCNLTCNNRANFVRGEAPNCECVCNPGFAGEFCEHCADGFTTDPDTGACIDECTNVNSSCMFATEVRPHPDCECICMRGYTGVKCDRCAPGFINYPDCIDNCSDIRVSCNNDGAVSVMPFSEPPNCRCTCSPTRSGAFCERCISTRTNFPLCSQCNSGYGHFPLCVDVCSNVNVSCGGRATDVSVQSIDEVGGVPVYTCQCACKTGYGGAICNRCASGYGWYPQCVDACNVTSVSCGDGAFSVERLDSPWQFPPPPPEGCRCLCLARFGGSKCDRCATGYSAYPQCIDNCTDHTISCEGRGTAVEFVSPGQCQCTCIKRFVGQFSRCNSCAPGFDDPIYPICGDRCESVAVSCNGRAFSLRKQVGDVGCICDCWQGWGGDDCSVCSRGFAGPFCTHCAPGFSGPDCTDDCTNVTASCSANADGVGGLKPDCRCYCKIGWAGERCTFCARGYTGDACDRCDFGFEGYPNCLDRCTETGVSCSNRAMDVTGSNGNCTCFCFPGYGPPDCSSCATGFMGTYCRDCQPGYSGTFCQDDCTIPSVSCNGRGLGVAMINGECVCNCIGNYAGNRCDRCKAGYINYPDCVDGCLLANVSCTRNATAVMGSYPFCHCVCEHPFAGRLCEKCVFGYDGQHCERCADQFFGYPDCIDDCTNITASCGGPATGISGSPGNCLCQCAVGFAGRRCENCAEGYGGWPECELACSASRCNFRAIEVLGDYPNCTCVCAKQFGGATCERCKPNYQGPNCGECAPGFINFPDCIDGCNNVSVSCFGAATSVTGTPPNCRCSCLPGFAGDTCSGCLPGYEYHPFCSDACTLLEVSCNASRATAVYGPGPTCTCECLPGFSGFRCNSCEYGYEGPSCDRCRPGFHNISGLCQDFCVTVDISCNGRAFSVANGTGGDCICDCIHRFAGLRCDRCARGFTGSNCDRCEAGFINYPLCTETCTHPSISCNGRGLSVTGSFPDCKCTCQRQFSGDRCERCAQGFAEPTCMTCEPGYAGPDCTEDCTSVEVSCRGRAFGVVQEASGECTCDCWPQWAQPTCMTCFKTYTGDNCDACAAGFTNYPHCVDACTVPVASCNGIASEFLVQNMSNCRCKCPTGFDGNRCESCASGYSGWPHCKEDCSDPAVSCRGRAFNVWGSFPSCVCNCTRRFAGEQCERCSYAFNSSSTECDECAIGFSGYPDCRDDCSDFIVSCLGHGLRLSDITEDGDCTCQCKRNYAGKRCDRCASGFEDYPNCTDACEIPSVSCNGVGLHVSRVNSTCVCSCPSNFAGVTCNVCAPGFMIYPDCIDSCTLTSVSCSGNAHNVSGVFPNCNCDCKASFAGSRCDRCADGFVEYPLCFDNCTNAMASCNGNAVAVRGTPSGCLCECHPNFAGQLCDRCAPGYEGYPNCSDACTHTNVSCNDRATSVQRSSPHDCTCECIGNYAGNRCDRCKIGFALPDCVHCATGFFTIFNDCDSCSTGYKPPLCTDACTHTSISCSGYAHAVAPHPTIPDKCVCGCYRGFAGERCDRCAEGFSDFPNCTDQCLTVSTSCSGAAFSVRKLSTPGECNCTCFANFTGSFCGECLPGYGPFPTCRNNCSDVAVACSGHALAVRLREGAASPYDNCQCTCKIGFDGPTCNRCAPGFVGFPNCTDSCALVNVSCNNHASAVRRNATSGTCICDCLHGYSGVACELCAAGFVEAPPDCLENCSDVGASCNGHADAVRPLPITSNATGCNCSCSRGFEGGRCGRCAAGFASYPHCFDTCQDPSVTCHARAAAVSVDPSEPLKENGAPTCACTCFRGYNGTRCERCADGYNGWPHCSPDCNSVEISCNDAAVSVNGTFPECTCWCNPGVEGQRCERCKRGYSGWPHCSDDCSVPEVSCGAFGIRILSQMPRCVCECVPPYTGDRCDECHSGFTDFPTCRDACTVANVSCRHDALSVRPASSGLPGECDCECQPKYSGPRCEECSVGRTLYPACIDACTHAAVSCHGNGVSVSGVPGGCVCVCEPRFQGRFCDECANGYTDYPNCVDACTLPWISCKNNATDVVGPSPNCTCRCPRGLAGARCDRCADGFSGYPVCEDNCTSPAISCSNRAFSVAFAGEVAVPGNCACNCFPGYAGQFCERCAPGFLRDPRAPAVGDVGDCIDACTDVNVTCHGHASNVSGPFAPHCVCQCEKHFAGTTCDHCAEGYIGYPNCSDACTSVSVSCSGHARAVRPMYSSARGSDTWTSVMEGAAPSTEADGNASRTASQSLSKEIEVPLSCECDCDIGYEGARCERCAAGFRPDNNSNTSTTCHDACTIVNVSCGPNAVSVANRSSEAQSGCSCTCKRNFTGDHCDECAIGFIGYPTCEEDCTDLQISCNGFASELTGGVRNCVCRCFPGYAGAKCERCADTHHGYPDCVPAPPPPPLPPAALVLVGAATVDAVAIRTGIPLSRRSVMLSLMNDEFAVDAARQFRSGGISGFFHSCLHIAAADDFPFGVRRHLGTLWSDRSILAVNATHLVIQFIPLSLFDVPEQVQVSITMIGNCSKRAKPPDEPQAIITVRPEMVSASAIAQATAILGVSGALGIVTMSPSALMDGQVLAMLGSMGCAKARSRAARSAASWMMSPFGFWGDRQVRYTGAVVPFIVIPALHFLLTCWWSHTRASKQSAGSAADAVRLEHRRKREELRKKHGLAAGNPASLGESAMTPLPNVAADTAAARSLIRWIPAAVAAKLCFPGVSLFLARLFVTGVTFYSVEMIREFSSTGVTLGIIGGLFALAHLGAVAFFALRNPLDIAFTEIPAHERPSSRVLTFFVPATCVTPDDAARQVYPAFSEFRRVVFVALDVLNSILLAATAASQPATREGCIVQYSLLSFWFLTVTIVLVLSRPMRTPLLNTVSVLLSVCLCAIAVSSAVESDEPGGFGAGVISAATAVVLFGSVARALGGLIALLYDQRHTIRRALHAGKTARRRRNNACGEECGGSSVGGGGSDMSSLSSFDEDGVGGGRGGDGDDSDASSTDSLVAPLVARREELRRPQRPSFRSGGGGAPKGLLTEVPQSHSHCTAAGNGEMTQTVSYAFRGNDGETSQPPASRALLSSLSSAVPIQASPPPHKDARNPLEAILGPPPPHKYDRSHAFAANAIVDDLWSDQDVSYRAAETS